MELEVFCGVCDRRIVETVGTEGTEGTEGASIILLSDEALELLKEQLEKVILVCVECRGMFFDAEGEPLTEGDPAPIEAFFGLIENTMQAWIARDYNAGLAVEVLFAPPHYYPTLKGSILVFMKNMGPPSPPPST